MNRLYIAIIASIALLFSCNSRHKTTISGFDNEVYTPVDATGFEISSDDKGNVMITVINPWQGATDVANRLIINHSGSDFEKEAGISVLKPDPRRIVVMSSTFVAMLENLDALDRIVGVSGIDFIASEAFAAQRDRIADVGNETNVDFEKLVSLKPDLVLIYGVNGNSAMESKLIELGLPYLYLGDYLEQSPTGKAEWLVVVGEIIGRREEAVATFEGIRNRYNALASLARNAENRPKVMINMPYGDTWFMPSTSSYAVRLISDAGADYVYDANHSDKSEPIDIETAYRLASESDFWLSPGTVTDLPTMRSRLPRFRNLPVMNHVYNNNLRQTLGGGNDYYESGAINPDLVLRDLITIFHPEILTDSLTYYRYLR